MKYFIVVPNWNGAEDLRSCLNSLRSQTLKPHIIVVDNGSVDESVEIIEKEYPEVELIKHSHNKGYAGGVNPGFKRAIEMKATYVAPFNNDAIAGPNWLKRLVEYLDNHPDTGAAASKLISIDGKTIDSTGEAYSIWGLPYPRGRGESNLSEYDYDTEILGASGGCSVYRVSMLEKVGLFDEDFFAYYEDVDLSLRAQLAAWKVAYVPSSVVYHHISKTGAKIKGFFTHQTVQNYPLLLIKDVPTSLIWHVLPRFLLAYAMIIGRAVQRGNGWWALKGLVHAFQLMPKKFVERHRIQSRRKVPDTYIWSILTHDLPPSAHNLRKLRNVWWKLRGEA